MKSHFYLIVLLLLIPFQASLLDPLSLGGIKPDLALALLYIVGLLTGPAEATIAGIGVGLLQDIGSASLIGLTGLTRGLVGLSAGLLGKQVLDIRSPTNSIFLALFSLLEGICITLFMQVYYGSVPFFSILTGRLLPQAIYTGILGVVLLQLMNRKDVIAVLRREAVQKEL
jgi:rod shape-determining protein MreD